MAGISNISGNNALAVTEQGQPGNVPPRRNAEPDNGAAARSVVSAAITSSAPPPRPASDEEIQKSAAKVQTQLTDAAPNLTFSIDKDSGRTVIKVIDPASHKVLKQIPADEILRLDKSIDQMISRLKGLLIDRQD